MSNEKIDILTGEYVTLSFKKADVGQRIGAFLLDWLILGVASYFIIALIEEANLTFFEYIYFSLLPFFNLFIEYKTKGYTIGKKILGLRIISDECTAPSFLQCFMRWLLFPIDYIVVGLILMAQKGQRLGDMASGCQCICTADKYQAKVDLDEEFKYLQPNYKVQYPKAAQLNKDDITVITKVLYHTSFQDRAEETARKIEESLNIARKSPSATLFLKDILNDYKFLNK